MSPNNPSKEAKMRCSQQLSDSQIYDLMDTLSVQQEGATAALPYASSSANQWILASYLDSAAFFPQEKRSVLYQQVVKAVTLFIELNIHIVPAIGDLAEQSWVYGELVEAELQKEELELTLDYEAIPFAAVEVLARVSALEYSTE
jgi:hypothetical protein